MQQHDTPRYSPHLHCVYDETSPVGDLGRGTHYSVLQALAWHSNAGEIHREAVAKQFAVIWDEDHDERIIPCVEALLMAGLLYPISIIGERKGGITIILNSEFAVRAGEAQKKAFMDDVARVIDETVDSAFGDNWTITFGEMTDTPSLDPSGERAFHRQLINDEPDKIDTYIRNITNLWGIDTWN